MMLKNSSLLLLSVLLLSCLRGIAQSADSTGDYPLKGKWIVLSKIVVEKSDGKVIDQGEALYKPNEKVFDFAKSNMVVVSQDFGKHSETLPFKVDGNNLYLGKLKKGKAPYLVRYQGDIIKLAKTESRTKRGKTILKTEQVVLRKSMPD